MKNKNVQIPFNPTLKQLRKLPAPPKNTFRTKVILIQLIRYMY